jgi:hypothetical protein
MGHDMACCGILDARLAMTGFADDVRVRTAAGKFYLRSLERLAPRFAPAERLLERVRTRAGGAAPEHPLVRFAIVQAYEQLVSGRVTRLPVESCASVFDAATGLRDETFGAERWHRVAGDESASWVWGGFPGEQGLAAVWRLFLEGTDGDRLADASAQDHRRLATGWRLLQDLMPRSSRSAARHVQIIGIFQGEGARAASSSRFDLGGVVFLSRDALVNPWWTAEHLFHEALHAQLYDLQRGFRIFTPEARECYVAAPWNSPGETGKGNLWRIDRALAACHVYVYLSLLTREAERRESALAGEYGPLRASPPMTETGRAAERAWYLTEELKERCWAVLAPEGQSLLLALSAVLRDAPDGLRPPEGTAHLMLDRYRKEARFVAHAARDVREPSVLDHLLRLGWQEMRALEYLANRGALGPYATGDVSATGADDHRHAELGALRARLDDMASTMASRRNLITQGWAVGETVGRLLSLVDRSRRVLRNGDRET